MLSQILSKGKHVIIVPIGLFIISCAHCPGVTEFLVSEHSCPLPTGLANEDITRVKKFGIEVGGIVKHIADVQFDAELHDKLIKSFPDAGDINRLYALTFTACIACRLSPGDIKGCAQRFDRVVNSYAPSKIETNVYDAVNNYRHQLLSPLL